MSDPNDSKAIIPAATKALTSPNTAKVMLPIAGTAALAWAGRKALKLAQHALQKRRTSQIQPPPANQPVIYIRYTQVNITMQRTSSRNEE